MPQNPIAVQNVNDGTRNALWITSATVVKSSPGMLCEVNVLVTGSTVGQAFDAASTATANTSNQIAVLPNAVGVTKLTFPCLTGIVVEPGAGQVVSVSYR